MAAEPGIAEPSMEQQAEDIRARTIIRGLANGGAWKNWHAELMSFYEPSMEDNIPFKLYSRHYNEREQEVVPEPDFDEDFDIANFSKNIKLDAALTKMERDTESKYRFIIIDKDNGRILHYSYNTIDQNPDSKHSSLVGTDNNYIRINIFSRLDDTNHFLIIETKPYEEYLVYNGGPFDGQLVKLDRHGRVIYEPELTPLYLLHSVIGQDGKKGKKSRRLWGKKGKKSRRLRAKKNNFK